MKYLIMKCEELLDAYECDADRTPMYITDDWESNYPKDYLFEVYEIKEDNTFERIKDYDYAMESDMIWGYREEKDDFETFHMLEKFKNRTRNDKIPSKIWKKMLTTDTEDKPSWVKSCGYVSGMGEDGRFYIYGEYRDGHMPRGC